MTSTSLTIDTASHELVIGLVTETETHERRHSSQERGDALLGQIDQLLAEASLGLGDINQIIVRKGIGSYTGLRVGIAAASALAWSLNIPLIGVVSRARRPLRPQELARRATQQSLTLTDSWPIILPSYQRWRPTAGFGKIHG